MRGAQLIEGLLPGIDLNGKIDWKEYGVPGRVGVQIHPLYDNTDTGADGPAAALVRYRPGAQVKRHVHPGYELIYVLDGILENDEGRHGPGTLQICPPGSRHALTSEDGCTFLVIWERPVRPETAH